MRDEYQDVFAIYWPVGIAVFVVVTALVVFALVRFRAAREGPPWGREENKRLEVVYALSLAGVVAALLYLTLTTNSDIEAQNSFWPGALHVDVTAGKWEWRFDYPRYGISQEGSRNRPATLVVPADREVRFEMDSVDVQHAFWIPDLRFKRDAFPSRRTSFVLTFPDPGFHKGAGACAEFCGLRHTNMTFNVDVLESEAFERWARDRRAEARPA